MTSDAMRASGTGPGDIAPDGSAVEFYAAMPPDTAGAARVHAAIPDGASILELGAGTGRVTRPLLDLGHPVVAVDDSAAMLARIEGARTVHSRIQDLALPERFDAVLLMSYLIGYGDRRTLLDACRRHVAPSGHVIVERETPEMFETAAPSEWERDGIRYRMHDVSRPDPGTLSAAIEYRMGDRTWTHRFTSRHLGDDELPGVLAESGLRLDRFLDEARGWFAARPL